MAIKTPNTDESSMQTIMDAEANILQGMSWFLYETVLPGIVGLVETPTTPTIDEVSNQVAQLKTILCGYTAKECAMADLIKAIAKKTAADFGIDPTSICDKKCERKCVTSTVTKCDC